MTAMRQMSKGISGAVASILAIAVAAPAVAQQAEPAESAQANEDEAIVVTASRLNRQGFDAPTPTLVLGEQLIEDNAISSAGQLTNLVPQTAVLNSPTAFTQGFSGVAATTFNLRGLGSVRTLTLVDGRRHVPTAAATGLNIDVSPTALIQRVEIVTGGASADWGSDAVAGVVNLILKDELDGFEGSAQAGMSDEGDHENYLVTLAWGANFADDRAHVMVGGEWYRNEGVLSQADRDWSRRQYGLIRNPAFAANNGQYRFVLAPDFQSSSVTLGGLILSGVARGTDFDPGGTPRPFVTGQYFNPASFSANPAASPFPGNSMSGGSGVNPGLFVAIEQPVERYGVMGRLSYDFSDSLSAFVEGSFTNIVARSPTAFAHDAGIIFSAPFRIAVDNAFLPAAIRNQMTAAGETSFAMGRYSTDFGFIRGESEYETLRFVGGLEGTLGGFRWEGYYQYGRSTEDARAFDNVVTANLNRAVDSVLVGTTPTCRVNADANPNNNDPACVPINLFGVGAPSQAALDYIHATATRRVEIEQSVAALNITGDPFSTWAGPVSVALGGEYRHDQLSQVSDPISQAGGFFIGQTRSSLAGKVEVAEGYVQAVFPLLRDVPLARNVELLGALRQSFYTVEGPVLLPVPGIETRSFDVTTWKLGLSWNLDDQLRLRATRSRDIRAPNVNELFTAGNVATTPIFVNGTAVAVQRFRGGNVDLQPERADTWIVGAVYQPRWINGLRLSVDYYDIEIRDAIAAAAGTPQQLWDGCVAGNQDFCELFTIGANGIPTVLAGTNVNINRFRSRGLDLEASYRTPLSRIVAGWAGNLSLGLFATRAFELSQSTTIATDDRVGENGNNSSFRIPKWQFRTSVNYDNGPFSLYLGGRFISAGKYNLTYNRNGALDLVNNDMGARYYVTLSASYDLLAGERQAELYFVIDNLLDTDPPIHPQDFAIPIQGSGLYDVIGRAFTIGIRFRI